MEAAWLSATDQRPLTTGCRYLAPVVMIAIVLGLAAADRGLAQPGVFATAEGQLGEMPGSDDKLIGSRFESIRGQPSQVVIGSLFQFGGQMPPPPGLKFDLDVVKGEPQPLFGGTLDAVFNNTAAQPPASSRIRNVADDGDFVAFSFAFDGLQPLTQTIRVATYDETGGLFVDIPFDVGTVPFPDPAFSKTGVAIDNTGRAAVVFTDVPPAATPEVKMQHFDGVSGQLFGSAFSLGAGLFNPAVALLDPAGDRLVVASNELGASTRVAVNLVDLGGPTPQVLPPFPIDDTAADFGNLNPAVAADPATGAFVVAWENVTAVQGNPVDIRARRFDAQGNPVGGDFLVNTTTANAQGQPAVAVGPGGTAVVVWAGDAATQTDELDVFSQVYDADGNPIGGERRVNSFTQGVQDRPSVRFLPEPDARGQPQFVVAWRDVAEPDGAMPRGTGNSYKCFSIGEDPSEIFSDGFESGDTTSWSTKKP